MALSYINYPADGATTQFDITFGYLRRSHVFVFVENNITGFKWISSTRIEITPAPADGTEVRIQRLTDKVHRITDFADGQTLLAGDLDAATLQNFYLAQEMLDGITDGVLQGDVILNQPLAPNGEPLTLAEVQTLLDGAAANSPVIQQLLGDVDANGQNIFLEAQERLAGLQAETQARVDAIAAEADLRQAALTAEAQARLDALAGIQTQLDADVANLTQLSGALTQEVSDRQAAVQATATSLAQEVLDRQTGDNALDGRIDAVVASVGGNSALIATETQARVDGDASLASQLTVIQSSVDGNTSQIASEITARTNADIAFTSQITSLASRMGDAEAGIISVNEAVATETTARSTAILGLQTQVDDANAQIASNQTAISNESTARASDVSTLLAEIGDNEAAIIAEQVARSNAVSSVASDISALTTRVGTAEAGVASNTTAISTEAAARASEVTGLQAAADAADAAILSEASVRAAADSAQASDISGLTTRMGTAEAGVVSNASAISNEAGARSTQFDALSAALTGGGNLLHNADFQLGGGTGGAPLAWSVWVQNSVSSNVSALSPASLWALAAPSAATWALIKPDGTAVGALEVHFTGLPVRPGRRYVSSAYTGAHRCTAQVYADFYDKDGTNLGAGTAVTPAVLNEAEKVGGKDLDDWKRTYSVQEAPPNAAYALFAIRVKDSEAYQPSSFTDGVVISTMPMFEEVSSEQVVPSPWSPGTGGTAVAARVLSEEEARAAADEAVASDVTALQTRVGDAEASIVSNATAISDETSARTTSYNTLQANMNAGLSAGIPSSFEGGLGLWYSGFGGAPHEVADAAGSVVTDSTYGEVYQSLVGVNVYLQPKAVIGVAPLRRYRAKALVRAISGTVDFSWFLNPLGPSYTHEAVQPGVTLETVDRPGTVPEDGWVWVERLVELLDPAPAGVSSFRPRLNISGSVTRQAQVARYIFEDVTEVETVNASVVAESAARASADSAQASDISGLTTRMGTAEAEILTNSTAISDETGARTSQFDSLSARMSGTQESVVPSEFVDLAHWTSYYTYSPFAPLPGGAGALSLVTGDPDFGQCGEMGTANSAVVSATPIRVVPGRVYEVEVTAKVMSSSSGEARLNFHWNEFAGDGTMIRNNLQWSFKDPESYALGGWLHVADGVVTNTMRFRAVGGPVGDGVVAQAALDDNCRWLRLGFRNNAFSSTDAVVRIGSFKVRDVTDVLETHATIQSESAASASADSAIASDVTSLTTRMGDAEADITTVSSVAADAQGRAQAIYGLRQDVNGYISGFGLSNDGATADFAILADTFTVARPGHGAPVGLFTVNGSGTVVMQNALIGGALIDELTVDKLTAGSLNVDVILRGDLDLAEGRITTSNGVYMKVQGVAFGANNDLIDWYGPVMAITACTKANAIMYADTAGNYHLGGGVTAEWASIQNVSVGTLDMAAGSVGASTVLDTAATFDLYTGANPNPVNASEFNTWTDTLPEVPITVGDQLVVDFSYDIECQFNAFEFYNFLDTVSVRYHFANGSTTMAYPGDWVKKRFFACASNGAIPSISGAADYDVLESFQRKLVMTIPDTAPYNTAGAELEGVEVILSVEPHAQPGQFRAIHGGTYTGSKVTGHLKLRDINAAATVFAAGPIATS